MRTVPKSLLPIGACAAALVAAPLLATPAQAVEPKSDQSPRHAKQIKVWPRMLFWGLLDGTDPTPAKARAQAPAANSIGLQNVLWDGGVPAAFANAGYSTYVWYNTVTKGDGPDDGPPFGPLPSPGWNSVAGTKPPADWIATDETTEYKKWAKARTKAPKMVAHRGGGEVGEKKDPYPENSIAAFKRAIRDGAEVLETDVQWTKPPKGKRIGTAVLMHDQWINRTVTCKPTATNCTDPVWPSPQPEQRIAVSDLTKKQLDKYQLSNGESIPTLQQFLNLANKHEVGVLPEIKNWDVPADDMRPELRAYTKQLLGSEDISQVIVGSFDATVLQWFKDQGTLVKQKATCAVLPKRLAVGKTVLLEETCLSNAGRKVKTRVTADSSVAKRIKGDNGRVKVKVKAPGTVEVRFWTKNHRGFTVFDKSKTYRVRAVNGNG